MGHENGGWMNDDQRSAAKADALFPIMGDGYGIKRGWVPMAIMRPHNDQAMRNHGGQSLERLRERGGLSAQEAMAVVEDKDYYKRTWKDETSAWNTLQLLVAEKFPDFNCLTGELE